MWQRPGGAALTCGFPSWEESFPACAPIPGSASRASARVWVSESVCPSTKVAAGALVPLPQEISSGKREGGPPIPEQTGFEPWPHAFSVHSLLTSPLWGLLSLTGMNPPRRAFQELHDGIFEQLPMAGVQIFLLQWKLCLPSWLMGPRFSQATNFLIFRHYSWKKSTLQEPGS